MYKYKINFGWSEKDNCFIAIVPELNGCWADGETMEDCLKNVNVAISDWISIATKEGWKIPKPTNMELLAIK